MSIVKGARAKMLQLKKAT